jgi:hypothetical protein
MVIGAQLQWACRSRSKNLRADSITRFHLNTSRVTKGQYEVEAARKHSIKPHHRCPTNASQGERQATVVGQRVVDPIVA